jgi:hypothetical protein
MGDTGGMRTLLGILVWAAMAFAQTPTEAELRDTIARITAITGFEAKRPVPVSTLSREGWKVWVDEQLREQAKPEEVRREELALKMFGLVPPDFDLVSATVDLLGEQAAAVYDHRKKRMIFVEGAAPAGMQDAVLVHELAHAVADQHFDMARFLDKGVKSDDAQFARLAVVEGQAMWIMMEDILQKAGQSLKNNSAGLKAMLPMMGQLAASQYPVFHKTPLLLRESLLFPYSAGLIFQQAVLEKLGQAGFREVLRNPPSSTRQVLHPEVYFAREAPVRSPLAAVNLSGYKKLTDGDLSEFDLQIILREGGMEESEARQLAEAWRGGSFDLHESAQGRKPLLRWVLTLSTPDAAARVLAGYRHLLAKKAGETDFDETNPNLLAGRNGHGWFRLQARGAVLEAVEGLQLSKPGERPGL